jgi:hypothetical protein
MNGTQMGGQQRVENPMGAPEDETEVRSEISNLQNTKEAVQAIKDQKSVSPNPITGIAWGIGGFALSLLGTVLIPFTATGGVVIGAIIGFGVGVKKGHEKITQDKNEIQVAEEQNPWLKNTLEGVKIGAAGFFLLANLAFTESEKHF